ncbi:MAG: pilus assembly protein [Proteobacteria bacterium]|nr:MAG: pilus assembly protein [Pseudomonadota bacterium]
MIRSEKSGKRKKSLGQGMTEYIIIVAVIAIAAIGAFGYFGDTVEGQLAGIAKELSGEDGSSARNLAKQASTNAFTVAKDNKNTLATYHANEAAGAGNP